MSSAPQATAVSTQKTKESLATNIPTPPDSPQDDFASSDSTLISISTTFFPGAQTHSSPSDLVLLSSDSVFFYVHSNVLLSASKNNFASLLPAESIITQDSEPIVPVPDSSDVLNVLLHATYDLSCTHYSPALPTLIAALDALKTYGLDILACVRPSSPIFSLLLSHAPASPLEVYALASHHDLHDLAVSTSPHLLSFPLYSLTDDAAQTIGPLYLKRLFFLHLGRSDALKRLLLPPPHPHAPTPDCDFTEQKKLTRAWALASAYLAWDARPDMPGSTLESALTPLGEHLWCQQCRQALQERIRSLIVQWSVVKRTI